MLVIFYTVELLRIVEGMHAAGFVHGDIKADNILMRFDPVADDAEVWDRQYQLDGSKGWSRCGTGSALRPDRAPRPAVD